MKNVFYSYIFLNALKNSFFNCLSKCIINIFSRLIIVILYFHTKVVILMEKNIFFRTSILNVLLLVWIWDLMMFNFAPYKASMQCRCWLFFNGKNKRQFVKYVEPFFFISTAGFIEEWALSLFAGLSSSRNLCSVLHEPLSWTQAALDWITADGAKASSNYYSDESGWPHYKA